MVERIRPQKKITPSGYQPNDDGRPIRKPPSGGSAIDKPGYQPRKSEPFIPGNGDYGPPERINCSIYDIYYRRATGAEGKEVRRYYVGLIQIAWAAIEGKRYIMVAIDSPSMSRATTFTDEAAMHAELVRMLKAKPADWKSL